MHAPLLYVTILVVSTCGLVFELLIGATATYLMGDSITRFATVIGVYLSAMGVGAWLTRHVEDHVARRFLSCQLAVSLVGGAAVPILFVGFAHFSTLGVVLYALVSLLGVLVGAELPLLMRVLRRRLAMRDLVARALTVDYAGALVGSLLFGLLLLPRLGMIRTGLLFAALNAASALWGTFLVESALDSPRALRLRAAVVLVLLLGASLGSHRLIAASDEALFSEPILYARQTPYQRIVLTRGHGGVNLFLDGNLQFSAVDEYRYHEALVHPALAIAAHRERVLVLGGGDGLAVRELLRWPDVQTITLVDLDREMTEMSRTLPYVRDLNQGSLSSPRVSVINDDAMVWLAESQAAGTYDVVIVDFPDPNNFALGKLYTTRFYQLLRRHLTDDGVVVVQSTSPLAARRAFWCIAETLRASGFHVRPYHAAVPTFGEWGWVLATMREPQAAAPVPPGLRWLTDELLPTLFVFSPDMSKVDVEPNRLNDQRLVRYYDEEWQRWMH